MDTLTSPAISLRPSPRSQRSSSISNDRSSLSVISLVCPPAVEPEPAYIAPSSASQIVTGDREPMFEYDDQDRPGHSAATNTLVAPNALLLLNAFLDQLLYSILVASRSTSIAALRPAVTEVLKPRLAKDAIASANEELHAFDGDNDELSAFHEELEARAGWDLTKIWRRTRLRCMVYTHLGDLEEQDEKEWLQRENDAHDVDSQHRLSRDLGVVSPTAAIFLTSILEYIAEQVLLLSAEAAYTRFEARQRQDKHGVASLAGLQRPSVEVVDIEKLAVNTTFGRLWRSWKRRVRSPSLAKQRRSSLEYFLRPNSSLSANDPRSREPSVGEEKDHDRVHDAGSGAAAADHPQSVQEAAAIPLPTTKYDAREIEGIEFPWQNSPREMIERPHSVLLSSDKYRMADEYDENRARGARRELLQRNRSSSLPPTAYGQHLDPQQSLYSSPREEHEPRAHSPSRSRSGSDAPAVMTMYDGAIAREEGTMGNNEGPMTNKLRPHYERYDTDARKLDEGLDCLTRRASVDSYDNTMNPARPGSGVPLHVDNRSQELTDQFPVKSSQDEGSGISQTQPWGVENQLDSSRMQGHRTENVSLGNRETSIVETQPPQNSEVRGFPVGKAVGSNDEGDDYVPATLDGSTWHGHRFNGPAYAQPGQTNGSTPRSHPEMGGNRVVAALSPSPTFPNAKPSVKLSEIRKQLPPVSTGAERASVQRVSSSPGGPLESPVGRPSTSSSRELRPINTSGSSTSPAASKSKVLGARGSSDTSRQYAVSRRSSEASNILATPLVKTPEVDETQRSFEQLIKSDETIQYTLTPQSVRESESLDSPRYSHNRTATADLADFIRTSGPPPAETAHPSTTRSIVSLKGLNGLRSNPTATSRPAAIQQTQTPKAPSQSSRPTTAKSVQGPPRDAQSDPETTQDFADFIRSTGPEAVSIGDPAEERGLTPSAEMPWLHRKSPEQRAASASKKKITKANPSASKTKVPVAPTPPPSTRPAPKLQAREPRYAPTQSTDLVHFLNRGPLYHQDVEKHQAPSPSPAPSATPQNPHVPTNLRDRFSDNARSSVASTQDSAFANSSIRSTNSRTALLDSSRGSLGGSPPLSQRPSRFDEPPQAARKQRRNKDPYALDTDSEDEGRPQTPKGQLEQESLMEFLSTTPPLSDPKPIIPSAFDDLPNPSKRSKNINKKATELFHQRNARTAVAAATPGIRSANPGPTSNPQQSSRGRPPSAKAPQLPPFNTRDISPHLISTYTPSTAPPTSGNNVNGAATSHLTSPTTTTTAAANPPRKIKPAGVARPDDREDNARTMSDLADFLRNSEPPMQVPREMMAGTGGVEGKEAEGRGIWGRLKKRRGRQ